MPPMFCLYGIFQIYFLAFVCCKLLFLILCSYDVILNDKKDVCDTFNSFFINVANDSGKGIIFDENNHPSIVNQL
jgi:arginine/lysine/ornithine decarboxylase